MRNKTPSQPECRSQTLSNQVSSCHFDFLRLSYFRGISSPCIEFNGTKARIVYRKNLMIYHLISQNGKHVPKTAQPSPDWPPLSELVSIIRQFPRKKSDTCGKTGRESKYKHDVNTFLGEGDGAAKRTEASNMTKREKENYE